MKYLLALMIFMLVTFGCQEENSLPKEKDKYGFKHINAVHNGIHRYENDEVICYGGFRYGLSCKWK